MDDLGVPEFLGTSMPGMPPVLDALLSDMHPVWGLHHVTSRFHCLMVYRPHDSFHFLLVCKHD